MCVVAATCHLRTNRKKEKWRSKVTGVRENVRKQSLHCRFIGVLVKMTPFRTWIVSVLVRNDYHYNIDQHRERYVMYIAMADGLTESNNIGLSPLSWTELPIRRSNGYTIHRESQGLRFDGTFNTLSQNRSVNVHLVRHNSWHTYESNYFLSNSFV